MGSEGDHTPTFSHKRDPSCNYFENASKQCTLRHGGEGDEQGKMTCKILRSLLRQCPGDRAAKVVERVEEETTEDAQASGLVEGFGSFGGFGNGFDPGHGLGPSQGVDPFDLMQRSLDQFFGGHNEGPIHSFGFGGEPSHGYQKPPHHRHRYGQKESQQDESVRQAQESSRRWANYSSEDV